MIWQEIGHKAMRNQTLPHSAKNLVGLWGIISILTFLGQIALGTSMIYALTTFAIFALTPAVIRLHGGFSSMGSLLFVASYAKLLFISQWLKIFLGQPADSYLQAPEQTIFVLLLGVGVFMLAGIILNLLSSRVSRTSVLPQDPHFLAWLAITAVGLTLLSIVGRHIAGLSRAADSEYEEGQGLVLLLYAASLTPLAVTALTARCAILSGGQRFVDRWVMLVLFLTVLQGFWENVRTIMAAGAVAFAAVYLAYGGIVRLKHLILIGAAAMVMQFIIFPLIDLQRGIERGLGTERFVSETFNIASDLIDSSSRAQREERLDDIYYSWDTRLYYGQPLGFLDRFSPSPLDETVAFVDDTGEFGGEEFLGQALYAIPNVILRLFDIERPVRGGEVLETRILGTFSNQNYGVFAETYAYFGGFWFIPVNVVVLVLYLAGLQFIYGKGGRSYFVPFGFSTLYFTYCNSDIADIGPQLTIQATMNLLIVLAVAFATNQLGRRRFKPAMAT